MSFSFGIAESLYEQHDHPRLLCDGEDIERLRQILRLKDDLGVNLAGIEVILNLLDRIDELQQEIERVRAQAKRRLTRLSHDW